MAGVLIATALGASVATATAVGTGVAAATAIGGSIKSFSEAGRAKKRQANAEREAAKAMEDARRRTEVNVMESLSVKKEPYEQQVMALLTQGQAGLQAGVEGDTRGAAATAGRVQMAQNLGQERVRTAMGQELQDIERAKVAEEARMLDMRAGLDLGEAEGYQQMAADAQKDRAAYITQGLAGLQQGAELGQQMAPLFGDGRGGDALNPRSMGANKDMLTRRQRAPYLESMEAYDASQRGLGQSVLQQSQFTPPAPVDQYMQGVGGQPDMFGPYSDLFSRFGGSIPIP